MSKHGAPLTACDPTLNPCFTPTIFSHFPRVKAVDTQAGAWGWTASCPTVALSAPAADSTDLLSQLREKIMETELFISKMFVAQVLVPETSSGKPHLPLTPVKKDR